MRFLLIMIVTALAILMIAGLLGAIMGYPFEWIWMVGYAACIIFVFLKWRGSGQSNKSQEEKL